MHLINLSLDDEQKDFLFEEKEKTNVSVQAQIRKAINQYIERIKGN